MSSRSSARASTRRKRKEGKKKATSQPMETTSTPSLSGEASAPSSPSSTDVEIQGTTVTPISLPKVTSEMATMQGSKESPSPPTSASTGYTKLGDIEEPVPEGDLGELKAAIMDHVRKNTCIKVASNIYKGKGKSSIARGIESGDVKVLNTVDEDLCTDSKTGAIRMEYLPFAIQLRREMGMAMDPVDQIEALDGIKKYVSPIPAACLGKAIAFLEADDDTDVDISFIMQLPLVLPHLKYSDIHIYRGICLYILHMIDGSQEDEKTSDGKDSEKEKTPPEEDKKTLPQYSLLVQCSYESLMRYKSEFSKDYPRKVKASKKGKSSTRVRVAPLMKFADEIMDKVFPQEPEKEK